MLSRKQYIEYKLKLAQRPSSSGPLSPGVEQQSLSMANKQELTQELQVAMPSTILSCNRLWPAT